MIEQMRDPYLVEFGTEWPEELAKNEEIILMIFNPIEKGVIELIVRLKPSRQAIKCSYIGDSSVFGGCRYISRGFGYLALAFADFDHYIRYRNTMFRRDYLEAMPESKNKIPYYVPYVNTLEVYKKPEWDSVKISEFVVVCIAIIFLICIASYVTCNR